MSRSVPMQFGSPGDFAQNGSGGGSVPIVTSVASPAITFNEVRINRITKIGGLCILEFEGTTGASLSAWGAFLDLPAGFAVANPFELQFNGAYNDNTDVMAVINNGNGAQVITKSALSSNRKISLSIAYTATA